MSGGFAVAFRRGIGGGFFGSGFFSHAQIDETRGLIGVERDDGAGAGIVRVAGQDAGQANRYAFCGNLRSRGSNGSGFCFSSSSGNFLVSSFFLCHVAFIAMEQAGPLVAPPSVVMDQEAAFTKARIAPTSARLPPVRIHAMKPTCPFFV